MTLITLDKQPNGISLDVDSFKNGEFVLTSKEKEIIIMAYQKIIENIKNG
jgi:hypothetical protein